MNNKTGVYIFDRIDLQVEIQPVEFDEMATTIPAESSVAIRQRVIKARAIQQERFKGEKGIYCNAQMNSRLLHKHAWLDEDAASPSFAAALTAAVNAPVLSRHIAEAIGYRSLDRSDSGTPF